MHRPPAIQPSVSSASAGNHRGRGRQAAARQEAPAVRPLFPAPIQWIDPLSFSPLYRETRHRSLLFAPPETQSHGACCAVLCCERVAGLAHAAALAPAHVTDARSPSFSEPRTCGASCPMCPYNRCARGCLSLTHHATNPAGRRHIRRRTVRSSSVAQCRSFEKRDSVVLAVAQHSTR
jgi:hypothetical protein